MAEEINAIGAYHLADNPDLYEVQRANNFDFIVTGIDNIVRAGMDDIPENRIANASHVLRFSVKKASIPFFTQSTIEIKRGNSIMKAAGAPTFAAGSITVYDYIGADSKSALMAWQNLSYNAKTEKIGAMKDYKKTCYLNEYTPDYKLVRTWKLLGCWISGLSESEFSHDNTDKQEITATIEYDKAFMELPDEAE